MYLTADGLAKIKFLLYNSSRRYLIVVFMCPEISPTPIILLSKVG